MSLNITNFLFTTEVLNNLDIKYTKDLDLNYDKLFIYSNIIDIPELYNAGCFFKKTNYSLVDKIHYQNRYELLSNIISYIKVNGYHRNNILLFYGIVCNLVLYDHLDNYLDSFNTDRHILTRDIDYLFGLRNNFNLVKMNIPNFFQRSFVLDFNDYDILHHLWKKTYYFTMSERLYKIVSKKFKRVLKAKKIKRIHYKLADLFSSSKNTKYKYYMYTKKTKIVDEDLDKLDLNNESFTLLYSEAMKEALYIINISNNYLFYNKDKEFNNYFNGKK